MEQRKRLTTRRGALLRMLGVAAGAAGAGAFAGARASEAAPTASGSLTLYVTHMRQKPVGPDGAQRLLAFGVVVDAKGRALGSFDTANVDATSGALAMQTFELADGKLVGLGSNGAYVLIGGTGIYAGVAGSYVDRPAARLPGREFAFTFREGAHGV
jgi:hypothetical protein